MGTWMKRLCAHRSPGSHTHPPRAWGPPSEQNEPLFWLCDLIFLFPVFFLFAHSSITVENTGGKPPKPGGAANDGESLQEKRCSRRLPAWHSAPNPAPACTFSF